MTIFAPVRTLEDLDNISSSDILDGYQSAQRGDPEPGENRGRAFWHGWRNRMIDIGAIQGDHTANHDLKQSWLNESSVKPDLVFDDRASVVAMWRAEGIACAQVADGNF